MSRTVRFHEIGGPEVLRIDDVEVGDPGSGEVRLRIEAIGLNRADVLFRRDIYIDPVKQLPTSLGTEAAGVIDAIGPDVAGFEVGQAVSVVPSFSQNDFPMYGELVLAPAHAIVPRAEGIDAVTGAATWMPFVTAYGAMVQVGRMQAGDVVVVNAASSSLGIAAIQIANRIGATPIAITRTQVKKSRLLEQGADEVIVSSDEDVAKRVLSITNGRGAQLILDAVAGPGVADLGSAVAPDGTLFLWGVQSGEPTPYPGFELGMPALNIRTFTIFETTRNPERLRRASAFVKSGLRAGTLRPVIDRTFGIDEIVEAHRHMESNTQFGKIVVTVDG